MWQLPSMKSEEVTPNNISAFLKLKERFCINTCLKYVMS